MSSVVLGEVKGQEAEGRDGIAVMRPLPHAARNWSNTYYLQDNSGLELALKIQINF